MIAWLIDPNEGHCLGDFFFKTLLYSISNDANFPLEIEEIENIDYNNLIVDTEYTVGNIRIDIIVRDATTNKLFVIENKTGSRINNNQDISYRKWANSKAPNDKTTFILIDSHEKIGEIDGWCSTNYDWLIDGIKSVLKQETLNKSVESILRDYYIELTGDYTVDGRYEDDAKHFSYLADNYRQTLLKVKQYYIDKNSNNRSKTIFANHDGTGKIINKYRYLFESLIEYSGYDRLEQDLLSKFANELEFEQGANYLCVTIKALLSVNKNGMWPIFLRLSKNKNCDDFTLSLCLRTEHCNNEGKPLLTKIAKTHNRSLRKSCNIKIETFNEWDYYVILNAITREIEKIREHIKSIKS